MASFKFPGSTIGAGEWYRIVCDESHDELRADVLVVAADSTLEFLDGPLNCYAQIVVTSIDFNDGRFFSIGRQIRLHGYAGRLMVVGNILPDQYTALLSCGFDDALVCDDCTVGEVVEPGRVVALAGVEYPVSRNLEHHSEAGNS